MGERLDRERVLRELETARLGRTLICLEEVDSTFRAMREAATQDAPHGTVVLAEKQTAGRGRFDRRWESPFGLGLCFNVLLKPSLPPAQAARLNLAAAVGLCRGLQAMGLEAGIKWPNDLIISGKKVCGMLSELKIAEGKIQWISLGIGLNVLQAEEDFPPELRDKAASLQMLTDKEITREGVLCAVLKGLEESCLLAETDFERLLTQYRGLSVTLGREVICSGGADVRGIAEDINADGALLVRGADGKCHTLEAGDVSVRGVMGYV